MAANVLLIRPDHAEIEAAVLRAAGLDVVVEPWLVVRPTKDAAAPRALADDLQNAGAGDWLAITSPRTWSAWQESAGLDLTDLLQDSISRGLRIIVTGPATARSLPLGDALIPADPSAAGILLELAGQPVGRLLLPHSAQAYPRLAAGLASLGWVVRHASVYETATVETRPTTADALAAGHFDAVVLRSPSAVRALEVHCPIPDAAVVTVGPSTTKAAEGHGWRVIAQPVLAPPELAARIADALQEGTPQ